MQIMITMIKVPERVRKELGNIEGLMESMKKCGQLNPITVSREMELITGFRRYTAAQRLGWKMVDVVVVDAATAARKLEMEMAENFYRKDFTPEELLEGYKKLEKLNHPSLGRRVGAGLKKAFSKLAFWKWFKKNPKSTEGKQVSTEVDFVPPKEDPTIDEISDFGV